MHNAIIVIEYCALLYASIFVFINWLWKLGFNFGVWFTDLGFKFGVWF